MIKVTYTIKTIFSIYVQEKIKYFDNEEEAFVFAEKKIVETGLKIKIENLDSKRTYLLTKQK